MVQAEQREAVGTIGPVIRRALASPAGRACLELVLVIVLRLIFNADGAFFKLGRPTATHCARLQSMESSRAE